MTEPGQGLSPSVAFRDHVIKLLWLLSAIEVIYLPWRRVRWTYNLAFEIIQGVVIGLHRLWHFRAQGSACNISIPPSILLRGLDGFTRLHQLFVLAPYSAVRFGTTYDLVEHFLEDIQGILALSGRHAGSPQPVKRVPQLGLRTV